MIFTHCPRVSLTRITFCWWRHNRLLMASRWPDKCDAITWIVISNSLDIDFSHSDIHGRSSKKIYFKTFLLTYNALTQLAPAYLNEQLPHCCCLYTPPGGFHSLLMIEPLETNFSEISIKIKTYSLKTCRWNLRVPHICLWVVIANNRKPRSQNRSTELKIEWIGLAVVELQHLQKFGWLTGIPTWWCHQMETFSALLALCAGNSPGEIPA